MDKLMPHDVLTTHQSEFLRSIDTPTVCNLIEVVMPSRRGSGYTVKHLRCPFPDLPAIVGYAKTVRIKSREPFKASSSGYMAKRLDYLDYVAAEPRPSISVIEDTDGEHAGYGAFWGEVQTNVHKALGVLGVITNGSVRDIPMVAKGFQMLADRLHPRMPLSTSRSTARRSMCTAWRSRAATSFTQTGTAPWLCRPTRSTR